MSAKNSCPLDGECLTKCFVYKATMTETTLNNQETYIGLTENEFKTRFNLHKSSFKLERHLAITFGIKKNNKKNQHQHQMGGHQKSEAIRTK